MLLTRSKIDRFFDNYFSAEKGRRVSPRSVKNYRSTISRYAARYERLDDRSVSEFLASYPNPASANVVLVRLNALAEYLDAPLKVTRAKEKVKNPEALSSSELTQVVSQCFTISSTLGHAVRILANTGMRVHELYTLNEGSLHYRDGVPVLKILGKGQKERDVPLSAESVCSFQALTLPVRTGLTEKNLRKSLSKAGKRAGIPIHVHPHLLRASCASILLNERGVDSVMVARLLGWSKTDTLLRHYYKPAISTLAKMVY